MLRISVLTLTCINSNSVNEFILFQSRGFQWEWEAVTFLLFRTELNYSKILHKEIHILLFWNKGLYLMYFLKQNSGI